LEGGDSTGRKSVKTEIKVADNFSLQLIFVLNSLAYITIPKNNGKININYNNDPYDVEQRAFQIRVKTYQQVI